MKPGWLSRLSSTCWAAFVVFVVTVGVVLLRACGVLARSQACCPGWLEFLPRHAVGVLGGSRPQ